MPPCLVSPPPYKKKTPVVASNRVGTEEFANGSRITFYGGSFISGIRGEVLAQVGADGDAGKAVLAAGNIDPSPRRADGFVVREFDLDALRAERAAWGVFRDRRPELYGPLVTLDGGLRHAAGRP